MLASRYSNLSTLFPLHRQQLLLLLSCISVAKVCEAHGHGLAMPYHLRTSQSGLWRITLAFLGPKYTNPGLHAEKKTELTINTKRIKQWRTVWLYCIQLEGSPLSLFSSNSTFIRSLGEDLLPTAQTYSHSGKICFKQHSHVVTRGRSASNSSVMWSLGEDLLQTAHSYMWGAVGDTPYWTTITYYTDTTDGTVQ